MMVFVKGILDEEVDMNDALNKSGLVPDRQDAELDALRATCDELRKLFRATEAVIKARGGGYSK